MKFSIFAVLLWFGASAQAAQYSCEGMYSTKGAAILTCDGDLCSVTGSLSDELVVPQTVNLAACSGERRAETKALKYVNTAFYDVKANTCWVDYIRVDKRLLSSGVGYASLVRTSGGDQHDNSGYQYLYLSCK